MLRSALLTIGFSSLICSVFLTSANADVYKYTDEKGNVLYTDKPMFLPAERLNIKTESSNIVDINARNAEESAAQSDRDAVRKATKESAADKGKAKESNAEGKAEACNKARTDYLARMNAQRLYEEQPNGERRYLSAKELDATRATAKQAMDALCN